MTKIGYLIPEYPGQTHSFFWREIIELRRVGIFSAVVSTRRPKGGSTGHGWETEPEAGAYYLTPLKVQSIVTIAAALLTAVWDHNSRERWRKVLSEMGLAARAEDSGPLVRNLVIQAALICAGVDLVRLAGSRGLSHIHVHSCANAAQVALYAKSISGLPYSISLHGPLGDYGPNQAAKWRNASFALVITKTLLESVRVELEGSLPPVVAIAPMGVQTLLFSRKRRYEPPANGVELRLISCGRLNESKGHDHLIRAVAELRDRGFATTLLILGEDETGGEGYRIFLEHLIEDLKLETSVGLPGSVPESEVIERLEEAHIFALASHSEPLGVAIMEAMSMQLPVVVTGAGGVPELVDDGASGILVAPGSCTAIADAIARLAESPTLCVSMGVAGREKVVAQFDCSRSARVLANLIESASLKGGQEHGLQ